MCLVLSFLLLSVLLRMFPFHVYFGRRICESVLVDHCSSRGCMHTSDVHGKKEHRRKRVSSLRLIYYCTDWQESQRGRHILIYPDKCIPPHFNSHQSTVHPSSYPLSLHSHTHACCAALYFCAFLYDPLSRFVFSVLSLFAEWPMDIWVPFPSITHVTVCVVFDCGSRHTCVHTGASQCVFLSVVCHAKIPGEYIRIHMRVNKLMHVCVCVCVVSSLSALLFTLSVATLTLTILSRTICPSINPKQPSIHNHLKHIQHHKDRLTQKHRQTQHLDQINRIT